MDNKKLRNAAEKNLEIQKKAVSQFQITDEMLNAIQLIIENSQSKKKIVTTGMGKAGIIASKMSAWSMAS